MKQMPTPLKKTSDRGSNTPGSRVLALNALCVCVPCSWLRVPSCAVCPATQTNRLTKSLLCACVLPLLVLALPFLARALRACVPCSEANKFSEPLDLIN